MQHTCYDDTRRIIPNRVAGYQKVADGYTNAEYLSMTQPYAAGGLLSTIDDLAIWDAALTDGKLLAPETLERAWTPYRLADGSLTEYGYGWDIGAWQGRTTIEHSGGIHGFTTYALRIAQEQVFVAVLSNNAGRSSTELLALRLAGLAMDAPYEPPTTISLDAERLDVFAGVYQLPDEAAWTLAREDERLVAQRTGWAPIPLVAIDATTFALRARP